MSQLRDTVLDEVFASFIHDRIVTPGDGLIIFQGMQDSTAESIKSLEGFDIAWVERPSSGVGSSWPTVPILPFGSWGATMTDCERSASALPPPTRRRNLRAT